MISKERKLLCTGMYAYLKEESIILKNVLLFSGSTVTQNSQRACTSKIIFQS
jgi:hypothetical protein